MKPVWDSNWDHLVDGETYMVAYKWFWPHGLEIKYQMAWFYNREIQPKNQKAFEIKGFYMRDNVVKISRLTANDMIIAWFPCEEAKI